MANPFRFKSARLSRVRAPCDLLVLGFFNQFRYLRGWADRLNKHDMLPVEVHTIGAMQLFAAFYEDILGFFGLRINATLDVVDLRQNRKRPAKFREFAIINLVVIQKDGLVGSRETTIFLGAPIPHTYSENDSDQEPYRKVFQFYRL